MRKKFQPQHLIFATAISLMVCAYMPAIKAEENAIVSLKQTGQAFATIAKDVSPAVVNIQSDQSFGNVDGQPGEGAPDAEEIPPGYLDFFRQFDPYGMQMPYRRPALSRQGSGFIISHDGYIVTNNHLVENASKITVKLMNNDEFTAKVIGTDPQTDIAVIKIDANNLPIVQLGNSDKLEVGDWVVALGNPFGLSHSLSAGILSAKGRSSIGVSDYENFLQTDAAINPGNSGGPLLDLQGKVVGINTAIFSRTGGYMGIGFAIPINMAKNITDQLIKKGNVVRGYLGVKIQPLTKDLATSFNIKGKNGILVAQVEPGSPAEKSGLKQGDVIVSLDNQPVGNIGDFRNDIASSAPDSSRTLGILRDNKTLKLQAMVGNLDAATDAAKEKEEPQVINKLGLSVQTLTEDIASKIGIKSGEGVVVSGVKAGSLGDIAGLARGSVVLEVNREKTNTVNSFTSAVQGAIKNNKGVLLLLVKDQQFGTRYVAIKLG